MTHSWIGLGILARGAAAAKLISWSPEPSGVTLVVATCEEPAMRNLLLSAILILGLVAPIGAGHAQSTTNTVTATCKDGTTFSGTKRSGACRGHGGVQTWGPVATAPTPAALPPQAAPTAAATPAVPPQQAPTAIPSSQVAPAGQVWVNTASKVYHCPGTRWYGKTKAGTFMPEAQARAQGDKPAYGKSCGS
jgi:hypothetical protein